MKAFCLVIFSIAVLSQRADATIQLLFSRQGSSDNGSVRIYDGTTGASLGTLVAPSDQLVLPCGEAIGPDGQLYIATLGTGTELGSVFKYDLKTGQFLQTFVPAGSGGMRNPLGIAFGPDGNLYVPNNNGTVVRFNGTTGAFINVFVSGLSLPQDLVFGPNGDLYVPRTAANRINRYNGTTGTFIQSFTAPTLSDPGGIAFGPDNRLYVTSLFNDRVLRFDQEGNYIDDFVGAGSGGLRTPIDLAFGPTGDLFVSSRVEGPYSGGVVLQYDGKSGALVGPFTSDIGAMGGVRGGMMFVERSGISPDPGGTFLMGDFNRDGHVNSADIPAMLNALKDLNAYTSALLYNESQLLAIGDLNGDDQLTNADVQGLLNLLAAGRGSVAAVPEPVSLALLICALPGLVLLGSHRSRRHSCNWM